jgi:hypothetical protein
LGVNTQQTGRPEEPNKSGTEGSIEGACVLRPRRALNTVGRTADTVMRDRATAVRDARSGAT